MRAMRESADTGRRELRTLLALVDGSLPLADRPAAVARLTATPEGRRALAAHRRTAAALRGSGPSPPADLRRRLQVRASPAPRRLPATRLRFALAGGLAALVVGFGATLSGMLSAEPSATGAAALAARPATQPAPPQLATRPELLARGVEGVAFPAWGAKFGWQPRGARTDETRGRRAVTVFYEHEGHRIGYTILSGPPLDPPADARRSRVAGVDLASWRDGMRTVVMFERGGHTCVLAGHVVHADTLPKLATWRGDGVIRF
jgi:anti-sigma factor RsiW